MSNVEHHIDTVKFYLKHLKQDVEKLSEFSEYYASDMTENIALIEDKLKDILNDSK